MTQETFVTNSDKETRNLGKKIAKKLSRGNVVGLFGDLGAGKTTLVKGIAEGLAIKSRIISPSFIIQNVHIGKNFVFYHFDLYRLDKIDPSTNEAIVESMKDPKGISVIEWAEKIENSLPKNAIRIELTNLGKSKRRIEIHG